MFRCFNKKYAMYSWLITSLTRYRFIHDSLVHVGISIVEYIDLLVILKSVQSVINIRDGKSLMYMFEIEEGGFISSKDGHNDREISGMIAQLVHVPEVISRIIVVPHRYRLLILSSTRAYMTRIRRERERANKTLSHFKVTLITSEMCLGFSVVVCRKTYSFSTALA